VLILRPVQSRDLSDLVALARTLDSVNLPDDPAFLEERVARSQRSFAKEIGDWREGVYVFMLEDTTAGRCVGTSMIRAKHGTPDPAN